MLLIEQLQYARTPRYNFSQAFQGTESPRKFIELSHFSLHQARGKPFQSYGIEYFEESPAEAQICEESINLESKTFSPLLMRLKPINDGTPVIAIDASSIRIGETETGILCAVRGAIAWNEKHQFRYLRLGPFPFHITEENKADMINLLGQQSTFSFGEAGAPPLFEAQNRLCSNIERWIQMNVANSADNSLILWDGSLIAGTQGNPLSLISQILKIARRNLNSVLSFTKATTVRFLGKKITDLASKQEPPCLFEVEDLPLSISKTAHLLGKIYVTKLNRGGCSFRLDIDRSLADKQRIMAVQRLLGNELIYQGYPETLRLAHIFSTFTANDVVGIQRFITREYGLKVFTQPSIRRTLFGPFGTGFGD